MGEQVSHADIMAKLDAIDGRLAAGDARFGRVEAAIQPLTDLIAAMGGEAQFRDLAVDAARGLAALAWLGGKAAKLAKWLALIAGGCAVLWAALKYMIYDMWRMG